MYLLKLFAEELEYKTQSDLHSTMYLLKLYDVTQPSVYSVIFTFHYVSIKTALPHSLFCPLNDIYIPLCIY